MRWFAFSLVLLLGTAFAWGRDSTPAAALRKGTVFRLKKPIRFNDGNWGVFFVDGQVDLTRASLAGANRVCYLQLKNPAKDLTIGAKDGPGELRQLEVETTARVGENSVFFRFGENSPFAHLSISSAKKGEPTIDDLRACLGAAVELEPATPPEVVAPTVTPALGKVTKEFCLLRSHVLRGEHAKLKKDFDAAQPRYEQLAQRIRKEYVEPAIAELKVLYEGLSPVDRAALAHVNEQRQAGIVRPVIANDLDELGRRLDARVAARAPALERYACFGDKTTVYLQAPSCFLTRIRRASWSSVSLAMREPAYKVSICDGVYSDVNLRERFSFCATVDFVDGVFPDAGEVTKRALERSAEAAALLPVSPGTVDEYLGSKLPAGCRNHHEGVAPQCP